MWALTEPTQEVSCEWADKRRWGGRRGGEIRQKKVLNLFLFLVLRRLRGVLLGQVLSGMLLTDVLQEAEGSIPGLGNFATDLVSRDGGITNLSLRGKFAELSDQSQNVPLGGVELVLELFHGYV